MPKTSVHEINRIWQEVKESAEKYRSILEEDFEETFDVPSRLERPLRQREQGKKLNRALPVVRVYEEHTGKKFPEHVLRFLLGRDVYVNVWDDLIDTPNISPEERLELSINADFADQLRISALPSDDPEIREAELYYKTLLFNIPYQESEKKRQMISASSREEKRDAAIDLYRHRSRVIDGFTFLPAYVFDISKDSASDIRQDLRTNTARRQIYKDIRDTPQDIEDEDEKPPLLLMREHSDPQTVSSIIRDIRNAFQYTEQSRKSGYHRHLRHLEREPDTLEEEISEHMDDKLYSTAS